MAGEIRITAKLEVINGNYRRSDSVGVLSFDQTVVGGGTPGQVDVLTTGNDLVLTGVTTPGWLKMRNINATNYVEWGARNGGSDFLIGRMEPGEPAVFRLKPNIAGHTFRLVANVATCRVQIEIVED